MKRSSLESKQTLIAADTRHLQLATDVPRRVISVLSTPPLTLLELARQKEEESLEHIESLPPARDDHASVAIWTSRNNKSLIGAVLVLAILVILCRDHVYPSMISALAVPVA